MYKVEFMKCKLVREKECSYNHINAPADAADILLDIGLAEAAEEYVYLFCLSSVGEITAVHEVAHGSLSACTVTAKSVFKRALLNNAASIIIAHNHPSGDPSPSQCDIDITEKMKKAGKLLDIPLVDHIILSSDKTWYSFKTNKMI